MDGTSLIAGQIQSSTPEILAIWRRSRISELDNDPSGLLDCMEKLVGVFNEFLQSPDTVDTFSRAGGTRLLVREIAGCQHEMGRDAVGVIEDFSALRRAIWSSLEGRLDVSALEGDEVARFFVKLMQASDWVTEAALKAFDDIVRDEMSEALGQAAATDLLTGLPDRDMFNRFLLPRAIEEHQRFSIAVFDVARFSETVAVGELERAREAVRHLSETVCKAVPESSACVRFGDDEICAILPGLDSEEAYQTAERVLERLLEDDIGFEVDVGVAEYPANGADIDRLIHETFEALNMAKRVGGSGIVVAR